MRIQGCLVSVCPDERDVFWFDARQTWRFCCFLFYILFIFSSDLFSNNFLYIHSPHFFNVQVLPQSVTEWRTVVVSTHILYFRGHKFYSRLFWQRFRGCPQFLLARSGEVSYNGTRHVLPDVSEFTNRLVFLMLNFVASFISTWSSAVHFISYTRIFWHLEIRSRACGEGVHQIWWSGTNEQLENLFPVEGGGFKVPEPTLCMCKYSRVTGNDVV
jgi:hypothetical protein